MGTIAEKLIYVNGTKSAIKTAIEAKGVTVGNATFREYATKIGEITTSSGETSGWQPDPLWTDIRDMYDNDTLRKQTASGTTFYSDSGLTTSVGTLASSHGVTSVTATYGKIVGDGTDGTRGTTYYVAIADVTGTYIYSAVYLISASDLTTVFKAGARYITSDGYDSTTELAVDYTHTWDLEDDIIDSNGAYTRWIKVYSPTDNFYPYDFNNTTLWVVWNLGTIVNGLGVKYLLQSVTIKDNATTIGESCFSNSHFLEYVDIPPTVTTLETSAFYNCFLLNIDLPETILNYGTTAFRYNYRLKKIKIAHGVKSLNVRRIFIDCGGVKSIELPNTLTEIDNLYSPFSGCNGVTSFILEENFNISLKLLDCDKISQQVLHAMIDAYKDNSGEGGTVRTLIMGATNLAKISVEYQAIAAGKNLSLA